MAENDTSARRRQTAEERREVLRDIDREMALLGGQIVSLEAALAGLRERFARLDRLTSALR